MNISDRPLDTSAISLTTPKVASRSFFSPFKTIIQRLTFWLASSHELRVWKTSDRDGNSCWQAYDPLTDRSICVASDAQMREWIEQRYYQ